MIQRDFYLNKLKKSINNGFPKIITGIRRCGKSYLLKVIFKEYLEKTYGDNCNIISIDIDDISNYSLRNPLELDKLIKKRISSTKQNFIFIDEIQLVNCIKNPIYTNGEIITTNFSDDTAITFVDVILGLSRINCVDLYVTGSNSKMLSTDLITQFRDKAEIIHLMPISYEEFYEYKKHDNNPFLINEYMLYGGMPLAVLKNKEEKCQYLKDLFETTYFKDILERNNIKKNSVLDTLCNIISDNCGQLFNSKRIVDSFKTITKEKIDIETVNKYMQCFVDSFIIREVSRFDVKGNRHIGALRKYYFVDNGLRNARTNFAFEDEGQLLENAVYNELIYNGYNVNVGVFERVEKDKDNKSIKKMYEIDFIAKKGIRNYYIQVCSDYSNELTRERETKPFKCLKDQSRKIIVINKPLEETVDSNGFTVIGIEDFLLRFIK